MAGDAHAVVAEDEPGLPEGSCSAYLRTRKALQVALTEYVASSLAADVDTLARDLQGCPGESDRAVQLTMRPVQRWVEERELLLASWRSRWRPRVTPS